MKEKIEQLLREWEAELAKEDSLSLVPGYDVKQFCSEFIGKIRAVFVEEEKAELRELEPAWRADE